MPERVLAYVSVFGTYSQIKDEYHDVECILVPESRLLAAEARVREMEEQASRPVPLDYGRHPITDARRDFIHHALTYPGFVGNRDLFVEAARDLAAEAATLRAERNALMPLARDWLGNDGLTLLPHNITREQVQAARAILDRLEKEGA